MHLFYGNIEDKVAYLHENEAHHACKVLRLNIGDKLLTTNGKGILCEGEIISISRKECTVNITKKYHQDNYNHLHIAIAPTKSNDRFEFFLEKSTEIGINKITPLLSKNSERKKINLDRYKKVLIAAMKQSQNYYLPEIAELTSFEDFIKNSTAEQKYIAHCEDDTTKIDLKNNNKEIETIILIGPEGDFSPDEITIAKENNFKAITLGNTRLRTETAGIVATTLYNL